MIVIDFDKYRRDNSIEQDVLRSINRDALLYAFKGIFNDALKKYGIDVDNNPDVKEELNRLFSFGTSPLLLKYRLHNFKRPIDMFEKYFKTSQLVNTLIPKGEFDPNKEYVDVSKYYIALYRYKRGKKYNFDIFTIGYNSKVGTYLKSIDDKIVGVIEVDYNTRLKRAKDNFNYDINAVILSANKFDSIRLLMYHNGLIKAYLPGKATEEEISEVISKLGYLYQNGANYMLDDFGFETGKRHRG